MIWQLVTAGNVATALIYAAITWTLGARLRRTGQLSARVNPLGVALLAVFATVALRAAWVALQNIVPLAGITHDPSATPRAHWTAWSVPLPFIAAGTGLLYLWLRRRAGDDAGPGSLYPDHAMRRQRALEINDNIVQGLIAVRELDAIGGQAEARVALGRTLEQAQRMMGELLDDAGRAGVRPGDLRRTAAAAERADHAA